MSDAPNLRSIDTAVADLAVIEALEHALTEARSGALTGIAVIKSYRGAEWKHVIAGDTMHHEAAGLNLRIDLLKRAVLEWWESVRDV